MDFTRFPTESLKKRRKKNQKFLVNQIEYETDPSFLRISPILMTDYLLIYVFCTCCKPEIFCQFCNSNQKQFTKNQLSNFGINEKKNYWSVLYPLVMKVSVQLHNIFDPIVTELE